MLYKNLVDTKVCEMAVERLEKAMALGPHANRELESIAIEEHDYPAIVRNDTDTAIGMYNLFADIQDLVHEKIEEVFDKELFSTYNYSRIYYKGDELLLHRDRPACECSVTLNLGNVPNNSIWKFWLRETPSSKEDISYDMSQGDAVIYYGMDQPHWRNQLEYEKCYQLFLHYVDVNGPNAKEHTREAYRAKFSFL